MALDDRAGTIRDGRNRYRACVELGVEPEVEEFTGSSAEAIEYVWAKNRRRRHLDASRLAVAAADKDKMLATYAPVREAARERQEASRARPGEKIGGHAAAKAVELVPQPSAEDRKTRTIRAKEAEVSPKYIDWSDRIRDEHPDQAEAIRRGEKTITRVQREIRQEEARAKIKDLPDGKYRVLYADPPWKYGDPMAISKDGLSESYGPADAHYPQMSIDELCALPIKDLAADDAVLFLWTTVPMTEDAYKIARAWGFVPKAEFVWDKIKHNMGHYNSVRHEKLLVCTRGSCLPDVKKLIDSVQSIERGEHSEKPEEFRQIIDTIYPQGPRIELFARKKAPGWKTWGTL